MPKRRLLKLAYSPGSRIVEPHIHGLDGNSPELLRCYQLASESASRGRAGWKLLPVHDTAVVEVLDVRFEPRAGYNPEDPAIHGSLGRVSPGRTKAPCDWLRCASATSKPRAARPKTDLSGTKPCPSTRRENALSAAEPQRLDQQGEGGRRLPAARVAEVVAREGRAPVGEHPDEPAFDEVRPHGRSRPVPRANARAVRHALEAAGVRFTKRGGVLSLRLNADRGSEGLPAD